MSRPVLYSFRRCPYAMRARLALASAGQGVALREVVLRDKPRAFLDTSPTATVPCLSGPDGVIDESLDIMLWALGRHDPESLLDMPENGFALIETCDGPFKAALDRYKYASRFDDADPNAERTLAGEDVAGADVSGEVDDGAEHVRSSRRSAGRRRRRSWACRSPA